jgi:glycosyltransferase involved in cell wall biosynthesis
MRLRRSRGLTTFFSWDFCGKRFGLMTTTSSELDSCGSSDPPTALPRLAYIADVPIEKSFAGMVIVYRLFERYPAERLHVFETKRSDTALRLPGVSYELLFPAAFRAMRTRFHVQVTAIVCLLAPVLAAILARRLRALKLEGIVTVSHGTSWQIASRVARRLRLPLYVVNHDYWRDTISVPKFMREWLEQRFAEVYRTSAQRFCVSPCMESYYHELYGVPGHLLYPGRPANSRSASSPMRKGSKEFRIGYAGSFHEFFGPILNAVAEDLDAIGGVLVVFSPPTPDGIRRKVLPARNVRLEPPIANNDEIVSRLQASCDALIVPMPRSMGINVRVSFPSKLVDYTATGLPVLIVGAPECSLRRWCSEHDAAIVVDEGDRAALRAAVRTLATDPRLRSAMGAKSRAVGEACFSYERTAGTFIRRLAQHRASHCADERVRDMSSAEV